MFQTARFIGFTAILALATASAACRGSSSGDDDGDDDGTPDAAGGGTSIYDVQSEAMPEGTPVTLEGVVVTAVDAFGKASAQGGVYVQEPAGGEFSGIFVFVPPSVSNGLAVGDVVSVGGGAKKEFALDDDMTGRKMTQLQAADGGTIIIIKTGTGTVPTPPVIDPVVLAADDAEAEKWEGVPVTFQNVAVVFAPEGVSSTDETLKEMTVTGPFRVGSSLTALAVGGAEVTRGQCLASITGIGDYIFNYKILPRSAADLVGGGTCATENTADTCVDTIDNDHNGFTDCADFSCSGIAGVDCQTETTVVDIQDGTIAEGIQVKLTGVVVTAVAKFKFSDSTDVEHRIWVADSATAAPNNGVLVFKATVSGTNGAAIENLVPGDIVTVTGGVDEFFTSTQIRGSQAAPATVERTGTGPAPTPVTLPLATLLDPVTAEPYEGVLVKIENVKVFSTNPDVGGTPPDVGEWTVGTAGNVLRIDDVMFKRPADLAVGDCYSSITGPLDFTFDFFKLQPRAGEAIEGATCAP